MKWTFEIVNTVTTGDKILIILLLVLSITSFFIFNLFKSEGEFVIIEVNGVHVHQYPLGNDAQIHINGYRGETIVQIKHRSVSVIKSKCPQQICVKSGSIRRSGELIVCVPNKVVVRIIGKQDNTFDVITQ